MIGERLKSLRKGKGLSQKDLASATGTSQGHISCIEKNEKTPGGELLVSLKDFFGVNLNWLLVGEGEMITSPLPPTTITNTEKTPEIVESLASSPHGVDFHLSMGDSMELLVNIHKSGNSVLIRAINANLMAFNEAIENRERAETTINAIAEMREQMKVMNGEIADLRHENQDLRQKILSRDDREQGEAAG